MTIAKAIERTDALKPNAYSRAEKLCWLSELDGRIKRELYDARMGVQSGGFTGYNEHTSDTTELIAPEPYSEIYIYWLFTKIDFMNAETARFNNSAIMFNTAWLNFANYINRKHASKQTNRLARV